MEIEIKLKIQINELNNCVKRNDHLSKSCSNELQMSFYYVLSKQMSRFGIKAHHMPIFGSCAIEFLLAVIYIYKRENIVEKSRKKNLDNITTIIHSNIVRISIESFIPKVYLLKFVTEFKHFL